jgi:HEAT repeat protein
MTAHGAAAGVQTVPTSAGGERVLVLFLRALMAARKSLSLYPAGSEIASTWVRRLHRSLADFFQQGLCFPIRVDSDRFAWAGPDVRTVEPTLEDFRFDLESRGIRQLDVDASVEEWELQAFLELLNTPGVDLRRLGGASGFLSARQVLRVRVVPPGDAEEEGADPTEAARGALQTGQDAVDVFVETLLGLVEARFADLTYDGTALAAWLDAATVGAPDRLYEAVRMLHALAEQAPDREVRTRTLVEALLSLPGELLRPFFTDHLIPRAGREVLALNLLSQMSEDELRHVAARLVPQESLLALSSELLEFPWEEVQRRRLVEAITSAVRGDDGPSLLSEEGLALEADDPLVVELREEILAACQPDALMERSADILLALVLNVDGEDQGTSAVDALEEILGEALARGRTELAARVLSTIEGTVQAGGARGRGHAQHLTVLQQRLAGRTHVALVGALLRQHGSNERQLALIAQYLGLVARDAIREFAALLAEEPDRQVRARMCQVLAKVGPPAVPVLVEWLEDPRWFLVRNLVHVLGKIGDEAVFGPVVTLLGHPHARVRIEAVRALAVIAPSRATTPLVEVARDADPEVRLEAIRALGALRRDEAVPVLRDVAAGASLGVADLTLRREAVEALAAIGTPGAFEALGGLARRRVWFWNRAERQLRDSAASALATRTAAVEAGDE